MSRSGYVDGGDCYDAFDHLRMSGWNANVRRCIRGRQGQAFMWELYLALDALPERALITGALVDREGTYCSLGAVARFRGTEIPSELRESELGEEPDECGFYEIVTPLLGIKEMLAREVMWQNDECDGWHFPDGRSATTWPSGMGGQMRNHDTPEERWQRMREWVVSHLGNIP